MSKTPCSGPYLIEARCIGCGLCAEACPCGAITISEEGKPIFHCATCCTGDPHCLARRENFTPCQAACPENAIDMIFAIQNADGES